MVQDAPLVVSGRRGPEQTGHIGKPLWLQYVYRKCGTGQ